MADCPCATNEEIRSYLKPDTSVGLSIWSDIGGLLAPRSEIDQLINDIESGKISDVEQINNVFVQLHKDYYSLEWTWAWDKIKEYYGLALETITATDIIDIVHRWRDAVIDLDKMIYADAKKEFSLSAQTSFGVDGDRYQKQVDFEQVRGIFEENTFVQTVLKHIDTKTKLGNDMIEKLKKAL